MEIIEVTKNPHYLMRIKDNNNTDCIYLFKSLNDVSNFIKNSEDIFKNNVMSNEEYNFFSKPYLLTRVLHAQKNKDSMHCKKECTKDIYFNYIEKYQLKKYKN